MLKEPSIGSIIVVEWQNSWRWQSVEKAKFNEVCYINNSNQKTAGILIGINTENYFIAQSESGLTFDNVFQIPKNAVKTLKVL